MNNQLVEYIKQNRDTYTREAIDKVLLDAGYTAVAIGAAWRSLEEGDRPIPEPPDTASLAPYEDTPPRRGSTARSLATSGRFWAVLVSFIILVYAIPAALAYFDASGLSTILFALLELGALVGGLVLLRKNQPVSMGLLIGVLMTVVVLPCVGVAVLFGMCLTSMRM